MDKMNQYYRESIRECIDNIQDEKLLRMVYNFAMAGVRLDTTIEKEEEER